MIRPTSSAPSRKSAAIVHSAPAPRTHAVHAAAVVLAFLALFGHGWAADGADPAPRTTVDIVDATRRSLVNIFQASRDGRSDSVGTGFVVSSNGLIATSLHVVGEARRFSVEFPDGSRPEVVRIHAWDRDLDLAVVQVAASNLMALPLGSSARIKQGSSVIALGNPMGLRHSVVEGVLSARRELEGVEMLQLAIPIEPGNSGGPVVDRQGHVVGIVNAKSALTANLGFATPVDSLKPLLEHPNSITLTRWLTLGAIDTNRWDSVSGARWRQRGGQILVDGPGDGFGGRALLVDRRPAPQRPFDLTVEVRLEDESGAAGLIFASDGADRHYGFYPTGGNLRLTAFEGGDVFSWRILGTKPSAAYRKGEWNTLRVRCEPDRTLCYVNDELVFTSKDSELWGSSRIGLAKFRETRASFRGFAVSDPSAQPASDGTPGGKSTNRLDSYQGLLAESRRLEQESRHTRQAAVQFHRRQVGSELARVLAKADDATDLIHACLLIARHDQPELDIRPYQDQVDQWVAELKPRLEPATSDRARVDLLRQFLFTENGFHGSRHDYDNPANSYFNSVMDDREGLPITLSVLFIELARRTGIPGVHGVPLPGHFIAKHVAPDGSEQLYDIFNGGRPLTHSEADEVGASHAGVPVRSELLPPATKRDIIVRMINNLQAFAERREGPAAALAYADLLVAVAKDAKAEATQRLDRARLRLQIGDRPGAVEDFEWVMAKEPPGIDADRIAEALRRLKEP